jgi:hypothetical protein
VFWEARRRRETLRWAHASASNQPPARRYCGAFWNLKAALKGAALFLSEIP